MNRFAVGKILLICAALLAAAGGAGLLAADDLPKAETILDKYVEVTGGKAAYRKNHNSMMTGTMEMGAMGLKGKVITYQAEPNKSYTEVEMAGIGKLRDGFDGQVAWSSNSIQGPHVKEGAERAQALQSSQFNAEVNWRDVYTKAETTGVETVEGKECYRVVLTPKEGPPITQFFDKQSGLLVKMMMTAQGPTGEIPVESILSDYRKEGDILIPHKIAQKAVGMDFSQTIDSVKHNVEIPKNRFDLPDEIKALVKKQ